MAKSGGLGQQAIVSGIVVSNDIGAWNATCPRETDDVTGIDKSAHERILLRKDGALSFEGFFNPASGAAHDVFSTLAYGDQLATLQLGTTRGAEAVSLVGKQIGYDPNRDQTGKLRVAVGYQANGFPTEWGRNLTAGVDLLGGAGNGTGVDFAASTAFGLQAFLHVTAFVGTSATVTIQESSDNGVGDAFANVTGGAFAAASAIGWQRIQTSRTLTVERYLRYAVTGTFSVLVFAVIVEKNTASAVF